jgi:sigma-B regulation protein RsbU (phosphoserine phosphatase)
MLKPNESIFFYTDGVTEAFNKDGEEFHETRLVKSLLNVKDENPDRIVKDIICDVQDFIVGTEQSDDITCMMLKYLKH